MFLNETVVAVCVDGCTNGVVVNKTLKALDRAKAFPPDPLAINDYPTHKTLALLLTHTSFTARPPAHTIFITSFSHQNLYRTLVAEGSC